MWTGYSIEHNEAKFEFTKTSMTLIVHVITFIVLQCLGQDCIVTRVALAGDSQILYLEFEA